MIAVYAMEFGFMWLKFQVRIPEWVGDVRLAVDMFLELDMNRL